MKKLKAITRNQVGVALAFIAGLSLVAGPILAMVGVWVGDSRWAWTAAIGVTLGAVLLFLAWILYDAEADA